MATKRISLNELRTLVKRIIKEENNNGKYKYMIITYRGEEIVDKEIIYLDKPYLETYDDEVPMTLGSNQALIYIGD
jgi:hypothetical protein